MRSSIIPLFTIILIFGSCTATEADQPTSPTILDASNRSSLLWPMPSSLSLNPAAEPLLISPCQINYSIQALPDADARQILTIYLQSAFKCQKLQPGPIRLNIAIRNASQMVAEKPGDEQYQLTIRTTDSWQLQAGAYVGFLRGLETFWQLFERQGSDYIIKGRPILIDDSPMFHWRGVMVDSSRHFLPASALKHQIDALLYNKMSVLHWHITDEDSFPLDIASRPQLSEQGSLSGRYSRADVVDIVEYGRLRGVRVIPEFDTPAHTESWGRSKELREIVVRCNREYSGQFDPTLNLTYEVVNDVMKQVNKLFIDRYMHLGGDQVSSLCYLLRPGIAEWMAAHGILTYEQLSIHYRRKQKQLLKDLNSSKKAIFWTNSLVQLHLQDQDVIHWWGPSKEVHRLQGRKNQVILSDHDFAYLDQGFGSRTGSKFGVFMSWRHVYGFEPRVKDVNVIGGQTCMWGELANQEVLDQKIWPRTSAFNERLWNPTLDGVKDIQNIAQRLAAHNLRLKDRGVKTAPVTVGLCEKNASYCWNTSE